MTNPVRLQLSRKKGFNLQAWSHEVNGLPAVMVTRSTRWGNPFRIGEPVSLPQAARWGWRLHFPDVVCADQDIAVRKFAACVALDDAMHPAIRRELGGKNLFCWCALGTPCHADVLLEIANREPTP